MNRTVCISCLVVFTLLFFAGCSSKPPDTQAKQAEISLDKIQGTAQVTDPDGSPDAALNPGKTSAYLWEGRDRYRLFLRTDADIVHGQEYVVEGINAQKAIEAIGDPDQGKNGYPLESSCERVVNAAWKSQPFDAVAAQAAALRGRIKRYPARTVFLVTRIRPMTEQESAALAEQKKKDAAASNAKAPEITVSAEKQSALLTEGSPVQPAPLFEPAGGTVKCKVLIGADGKIAELDTGLQLCEAVQWSQFRYKPTMQGGRPARVNTEVEMKFEPRK